MDADTVDDFARGRCVTSNISLIKIDIEGSELFLLRGGTETLVESRPIVIHEVEERHCERFGHSSQDVFDEFDRSGFLPFEYEPGARALERRTGHRPANSVAFIHESGVEHVQCLLAVER